MLFSPGLVPGPLSFDLQSAYVPRGRYEDALASSTEPCGFGCACGTACYRDLSRLPSGIFCFHWRLALIACFFIRNLRFAMIVYSGFTRGEYHVIRVDFIVALRRTKGRGRRTLRSPPSPSSGLHLIHPGKSAAAGHDCCRGFGAM